MKVVIHGPGLTDQSDGTYRVHAAESEENDREQKLNGSRHPDEREVASREDVVDILYPDTEFDREPDDLPMYIADVYFGESCENLPLHAENPNEGEDMPYTAEQKAEALKAYGVKESYRFVGKTLGVAQATAKKIVAEAQEEAAAAKAAATPRSRTSGSGVPAIENPNETATCKYCDEAKALTTQHWYRKKDDGTLHVGGRCKTCMGTYRTERKALKEGSEKAAAKADAQKPAEQPNSGRRLAAVA